MKRCPHCNALNADSGTFCWRCYKRLYTEDADAFVSLRRRIKERIRDIIQYRDIRELLKEKIREMREREERREA